MAAIKPCKKLFLSQIAEIPTGKPIVFWDTCSLLYIISIAVRDSFAEYPFYKDILSWIESGQVISVTSSIVWDEFNQHYNEEKEKAVKDIDKLRDLIRNYAVLQTEPMKTGLNDLANNINLIDILEDMEARVWSKTYVISEERQIADLAHYRVLHKISPSFTKDSYKDAYIWCTFMSMAIEMKPEEKIFMTDNRDDYCITRKSTTPQSAITQDCITANAKTAFHIDTLRGLLYVALHHGQ